MSFDTALNNPVRFRSRGREASRPDKMRKIIEGFPSSKLQVPDYCAQNGISLCQFQYWRCRLGLRFRKRKKASHTPASLPATEFVRLGTLPAGGGLLPGLDSTPETRPGWGFEVSFPNGVVFRGTQELALKGLDRIRRFGQ